jgi:hypothetical protein
MLRQTFGRLRLRFIRSIQRERDFSSRFGQVYGDRNDLRAIRSDREWLDTVGVWGFKSPRAYHLYQQPNNLVFQTSRSSNWHKLPNRRLILRFAILIAGYFDGDFGNHGSKVISLH